MPEVRFKKELENLATLDDLYRLIDSNWDHFFKIEKPLGFRESDMYYVGNRINSNVSEVDITIDIDIPYIHGSIKDIFINTANNGIYFTQRRFGTDYKGQHYIDGKVLIFKRFSPIFSSMMALTEDQ